MLQASGWALDKLGSWVQASDVVPNGGAAHLHAVGDGGAQRVCGSQVGAGRIPSDSNGQPCRPDDH